MTDNGRLLALHRYYIWANFMREKFDQLSERQILQGNLASESMIYMSYWYAGIYIVIERWKELQLHDTNIDPLICSDNTDLLRRFRNGVFHFQKEYYDERFFGLISEGLNVVPWIRELNKNFGSYFLENFPSSL